MPPEVLREIARRVEQLLAPPGPPVLVGVDGRSGSGKTELADRLRDVLTGGGTPPAVVHLDDLYRGWTGLSAGLTLLCEHVVAPLRAGGVAAYPVWDWDASVPGPVRQVPPAPVVLLEGVGVLASACAADLDLRIWLEAPTEVRRARALARDGATFAPWWATWAAQEDRLLEAGQPTADVVVDTVSGTATWARLTP